MALKLERKWDSIGAVPFLEVPSDSVGDRSPDLQCNPCLRAAAGLRRTRCKGRSLVVSQNKEEVRVRFP